MQDEDRLAPEIRAHYERGEERERLLSGAANIELVRTQELLARFLPPPPARVLDVGGGPGRYATWLAALGYLVHLIDPVVLHVEQARALAAEQAAHPFSAALGDARRLDEPDGRYDAVLLMGPLYHLTAAAERVVGLREARRVARPGGIVIAVAISRYASLLDGMRMGALADAAFRATVEDDLRTGIHHNPDPIGHPEWFTTACFHRPAELAEEVLAAGLTLTALLGIEGPGWLLEERWNDPAQREQLLHVARLAEAEPSLLGASAHLMAVARKEHASLGA